MRLLGYPPRKLIPRNPTEGRHLVLVYCRGAVKDPCVKRVECFSRKIVVRFLTVKFSGFGKNDSGNSHLFFELPHGGVMVRLSHIHMSRRGIIPEPRVRNGAPASLQKNLVLLIEKNDAR